MPDGSIQPYEPLHVIVHPHPLCVASHAVSYGVPPTIAEIVLDADIPEYYAPMVRVWIDDDEIPRHLWPRVRPKRGHLVKVIASPFGGGGGGGGKKNPLATILMLVVAIAAAIIAPYLAPLLGFAAGTIGYAIAVPIITSVINMAGALAISALIPPPSQPTPDSFGGGGGTTADMAVSSPTFQITGTSNRYNLWGPIPRVLGRRKIYPVKGARDYTETQGTDQYVRMLLCVGYGPLQISDIRIGDTPLAYYDGVQYEVREGWPGDGPITLYTQTIREDQLSIKLVEGAALVARVSHDSAVELGVEIAFPRGLGLYSKTDGSLGATNMILSVVYKPTGSPTWIAPTFIDPAGSGFTTEYGAGTMNITRATSSAVRVGARWTVASGTYDVGVFNSNPGGLPREYINEVYWTLLRTVQPQNPILQSGLSFIALRIKASNQLNGVPDQVNCIAQSYLPQWNGSGYVWGLTRNPAWCYLDVLRRRGTEYLTPDSRIDLDGIAAWAAACNANAPDRAEPYWYFDGVIEGGSVFTALRSIAAAGRASFGQKDGKYSVIRDIPQTVPVQHITPRNSWGYSGSKSFIDLPHALKIRFVNEDLGFQDDERIVYDDGQSEATASKFETIDLPACSRTTQAWREGRYYIAQAKLRPEEHKVTMDIESLRATMGDLVQFAHFAISIGLGQGRITGHVLDTLTNSYIVGIELDGDITFDVANAYALRCRLSNGASQVHALINPASGGSVTTRIVTLYTPILTPSGPQIGDLFMFGRSSLESAPMLVRKIEPGANFTAVITMCDAQPGVWTADSAAIPAFNSYITHTAPPQYRTPPEIGFSLRSDETALLISRDGGLRERIAVDIVAIPFGDVAIAGFEAQYSLTGLNNWHSAPRVTFDVRTIYLEPVTTGLTYDVRARSIGENSVPSAWRLVTGHTVIGKTTPPPNPTRVLLQGRTIVVDYPNAPLDFLGFKVEYHRGVAPNRIGAVSAHPSSTTVDMPFDISSLPNGLLTIFVTAMDTSGNLSDASTIFVVITAADVANIVDEIDYHMLGFPGDITNGFINPDTGDLESSGDPTDLFLPSPHDLFCPIPTDIFLLADYLEMIWEFLLLPDPVDVPSQMSIEYEVTPAAWTLDYTGDESPLFAALDNVVFAVPNGDEFAPIGSSEYGPFPQAITAARVPYHFRVVTPAGHLRGDISKFVITLDVPDEEEELEDYLVPAVGTRIPLSKAYREIRHIAYILQDDGNHAVKVEKQDYNVTLGPRVQAFNAAGTAVPAIVDFRIKGVRA